jgi:hypothetical protein
VNAVELLQQARSKIEKDWTQGWFARDANNMRVQVDSDKATCFCLSGAMFSEEITSFEQVKARQLLSMVLPDWCNNIVEFNDCANTSKQDVINLIDKAIDYGMLG